MRLLKNIRESSHFCLNDELNILVDNFGVVKAACRVHVTEPVEGLLSSQVEHHVLVIYQDDVCDEHSSREPTATVKLDSKTEL